MKVFITILSIITWNEVLSDVTQDITDLKNKVEELKTMYISQSNQLAILKKQISPSSTYCQLLPKEICGPCICVDDNEIQQKYYCDCQQLTPKRDCLEFHQDGVRVNGVYKVTMNKLKITQVYCDHTTDGGGWTVFQRRADGTINFYRNWNEYQHGFGKFQNEFWLGNENIHLLSMQSLYPKGTELRVEMTDWNGNNRYAKYNQFKLEGQTTKYTLHVSGYSGDAGDSLTGHSGSRFSTYDNDNDAATFNCARSHRGAWWYYICHSSNLNGEYRLYDQTQPGYARGVIWVTNNGHGYSFKTVEMKARRII